MPDPSVLSTSSAAAHQAGQPCFEPEVEGRFQVRRIIPQEILPELTQVGFDETYRQQAVSKFDHWVLKAYDIPAPAMNILKQECIAVGAEAGVHREAITCKVDQAPVLITATLSQLGKLVPRLQHQPFGLSALGQSIERMMTRHRQLQTKPVEVMAVINVTPDSFSDGGVFSSLEDVMQASQRALDAGVHWLDVGGESTRPGATPVTLEAELARVIPAIEALVHTFPHAKISVDTRKAEVAQKALAAGASMVNDVSGFQYDPAMMAVVADTGSQVVLMHSQGIPETMQDNPTYDDVVGEVVAFFYRQIAQALSAGIALDQIILDPGFGFGKTVTHNLALLRRLPEITSLGLPVLVGTSRKAFLTLGDTTIAPQDREALTSATVALALHHGAKMIRIHDAETQMPIVRLVQQLWADTGLADA